MENNKLLAEAVQFFPQIFSKESGWDDEKFNLLTVVQKLFDAEICALFVIHDDKVILDAHIGYTTATGEKIPIATLQEKLTYRITPPDKWGKEPFDGITGLVASKGEEFSADSWEEIKADLSHKGKPDDLGIWNEKDRPFRCIFAVPLQIGSKTVGILKVENKKGGIFDKRDKEILRKLAGLFSMAIGKSELVGAITESSVEKKQLYRKLELRNLAKEHDKSDMATIINRTPDQIEYALNDNNFPAFPNKPFDRAVVVGMGGSALPVEVINDAFVGQLKSPIEVVRHYRLQSTVNDRTLIIISSFSGGTEETISALESLPSDSKNVVIVTSGGKLKTIGEHRGCPIVLIPKNREPNGFQPRCATGYFVTYFARLLANAGILDKSEPMLRDLVKFLKEQIEKISAGTDDNIRTQAEEIASWFSKRIPVFYTDSKYERSIARIAKIKHNENSKRPAFFNCLPEANHNEMIGFSRRFGKFAFLYLCDPISDPRVHKRFEVMQKVFREKHLDFVDFKKWNIPGNNALKKIFAALMFADWCSYSLALLDGIDPTPVQLVEDFKKELEQSGSA